MAEFNEVKTPDMNDPFDGPGLPPAVRKVLVAMLGGIGVIALPYILTAALPDDSEVGREIAEFRVWAADDPLPFSKHFRTSGVGPATAVAAAGGGASILDDKDEGGPIDEHVAVVELAVDPVVPMEVPAPSDKPGTDSPPAAEQVVSPYARIRIPAESFADLKTFIEDPSGAMASFWQALGDVALKKPGAKVRISHWGDSAIAADGMPSATRRLLQKTFGDGGHGYAMVAASTPWYRRKDIDWTSKGWNTEEFIRDQAADGRYGYGGVVAWGAQGAKASWATITSENPQEPGARASRFEVHLQKSPKGGKLQVNVDGVETKVIDTANEAGRAEVVETIAVPDGKHVFEIRNIGGGRTRVYGVAVERSEGVVYDGLGVVGARDTRWLNADADGMRWALQARNPDLYILMYGGNALEDKTTMAWYRERLTEVLKRWKDALPGKSCLVMTPIDHGERYRGRVRTVPRQVEIMAVQREVALASGCAFFSIYEAMGGEGSIGRWFDSGLASGDLAHPTSKGSVELGKLFYQALMKGLYDWVATQAPPAKEVP